jgi:hypothetical protein
MPVPNGLERQNLFLKSKGLSLGAASQREFPGPSSGKAHAG